MAASLFISSSRLKPVKVFLFLVLIYLFFDQAIFFALNFQFKKITTGEQAGGNLRYALSQEVDHIFIGSSRMSNLLSPKIIKNLTNQTSYNAGVDGQFMVYANMFLYLYLEVYKHRPKSVVINIEPDYFFKDLSNEFDRLKTFYPFINHRPIYDMLTKNSFKNELKFSLSKAYRFNGKFLPILREIVNPKGEIGDGFQALLGSRNVPSRSGEISRGKSLSVKEDNLALIHSFIELARKYNIKVVLIYPPKFQYDLKETNFLEGQIWKLKKKYDNLVYVTIDARNFSEVFSNPNLFYDNEHLEVNGAVIYSGLFSHAIKQL